MTEAEAHIYVHSKIMIVDDIHLRVGSSNFNNRSMRMDTECDVILTARDAAESSHITALRNDLVAEHLGVSSEDVATSLGQTGSLIRTIDTLRGAGRSLVPYAMPDTSDIENWPKTRSLTRTVRTTCSNRWINEACSRDGAACGANCTCANSRPSKGQATPCNDNLSENWCDRDA